jgi:Arc/MetJ family transcription regulator
MTRTNIDIDDELIDGVMARFGFKSKREAVNHALRELCVEPMSREQMLQMEGVGWDGDLAAMRGQHSPAESAATTAQT